MTDNDGLIHETSGKIFESFEDYNQEFRNITQRARRRFEEREWKLGQRDAVERIELYDRRVVRCVAGLVGPMGSSIVDTEVWRRIRNDFAERIADCVDSEFYKTFFNSLTRKVFNTVGVNPTVEFVAPDLEPALLGSSLPVRSFDNEGTLLPIIEAIVEQFPSVAKLVDFQKSVIQIVAEINWFVHSCNAGRPIKTIEMLVPVFYRSTRAFVVGRMVGDEWSCPLVLAFKNSESGIVVDAVISDDSEVRSMFGFSRSYFHADLPEVGPTVNFLCQVIPKIAVGELYTVLGRAKQGKTERYRRLFKHLAASTDLFAHAEGQRGMVMIVFTLPSYGLVFKVIRDRFAYPKTTSRQEVMERYQFVFKHDRVGRLVDAQEFRRWRFAKARFSTALLDELLKEAADSCRLDGDDVIVEHCYIERRLRPLNLYLNEVSESAARAAVIDYGQAIRDLARSNVFPGDLLLKNFGVTSNGRIIFYDYDELCLVTDCEFRDMPTARFDEDEMRAEPWFHVGPRDIFPEQFLNFLGLPAELREHFLELHGDLLTAEYWRDLKAKHSAEEHLEVVPYQNRSTVGQLAAV